MNMLIALIVVIPILTATGCGVSTQEQAELSQSDSQRLGGAVASIVPACGSAQLAEASVDAGQVPEARAYLAEAERNAEHLDKHIDTSVSALHEHPDGYRTLKDGRHESVRSMVSAAADGIYPCDPESARELRSALAETPGS